MKRILDLLIAVPLVVLFAPLLVVLGLLVKLSSRGPILFRQERIGRGFQPFFIYKFRTMIADAPKLGTAITIGADPRITRIGRILRKTKLDELPQLLNVVKGDMSLVGPRPEVRQYVEMFRADYETILQVRPGVTDLASLEYRDEAAILGRAADPEEEYIRRVLPEKIRLAKEYVARCGVLVDLRIIVKTAATLLKDRLPFFKNPVAPS